MPPSDLLWILVLLICSGSSVAQKLTQVQPAISRPEGETVTLDCSYETSLNSYYLCWYKQLPSGEMIFLIYQFSSGSTIKIDRHSVNFQKGIKSISLIISALQFEDSAKYFCALFEGTVSEVIVRAEQKLSRLLL
ncbi:T-cell receptor alpha chain V region HPB-MLT [Fukomys damarensis]|nr:T-cell receptor alpha chain V region HPB-MLT [Fukomys damarensis]